MGDDPDRSSNDYRMLLATLATVTLATSSALLWRASRRSPQSRSQPSDRTDAWHFVLAAWSRADPSPQPGASEKLNERTDPDESANFSGLSPKESKAARSKERRRRGKDPVKDLRKMKDVLKPAKRASSPVRSAPPLPPIQPPHVQRPPSLPKPVSPADSSTPTQSPSTRNDSDPSVPPSDHAALARASTPDHAHDLSCHHQPLLAVPEDLSHETRSVSSSSTSTSSALLGPSPSIPSSSTSSPHRSNSSCASNKGSWDWDGQSSFYTDPPPRFSAARKRPVPGSSDPHPGSSQTLRDPSHMSPPLQSSSPASLPERLLSPSPSSSPASGHPRASASRRAPTPSSVYGDNSSPSLQTQIASLKGALEASKMREERQKSESDRLAKECDAIRWRWQEEIGGWRRREAELQGYIQYLTQTMHLYPVSPATHLQAHSPFSPLSPGPSPYANGFAPPPPNYGWSGPPPLPPQAHALATFFPPSAPSSTGSGSPIPGPVRDRGRRRQRLQDEEEGEGEGDWIDPEDGYADEDEDELQLSDEVADAILKRPESLKVKKRERPAPPVELGELRFPSISDWGNVWTERQEPVVGVKQEPEQEHEQEPSSQTALVGEEGKEDVEGQGGASTDAPREEQLAPSEDTRDDE